MIVLRLSPALGTADGATFQKALQGTHCRIGIRQEGIACKSVVRLRKTVFAGSAFPALNVAFTEGTSFHAGSVLASDAGHGSSPLDFCTELSHNEFGSRVRFAPCSGLAPQPVQAGSGALTVSYDSG
jgi:hypothetical protein